MWMQQCMASPQRLSLHAKHAWCLLLACTPRSHASSEWCDPATPTHALPTPVHTAVPCPRGTGGLTCQLCPPGTSSGGGVAEEPRKACDPCRAGTYASGTGNPVCRTCAKGAYSAAGASNCTSCPAGTTTSLTVSFSGNATSASDCHGAWRNKTRQRPAWMGPGIRRAAPPLPAPAWMLAGKPLMPLCWARRGVRPASRSVCLGGFAFAACFVPPRMVYTRQCPGRPDGMGP